MRTSSTDQQKRKGRFQETEKFLKLNWLRWLHHILWEMDMPNLLVNPSHTRVSKFNVWNHCRNFLDHKRYNWHKKRATIFLWKEAIFLHKWRFDNCRRDRQAGAVVNEGGNSLKSIFTCEHQLQQNCNLEASVLI